MLIFDAASCIHFLPSLSPLPLLSFSWSPEMCTTGSHFLLYISLIHSNTTKVDEAEARASANVPKVEVPLGNLGEYASLAIVFIKQVSISHLKAVGKSYNLSKSQ